MLAQDLLPLLRAFAVKTRSPNVDLRQFVDSLPKGQGDAAEVEAAVRGLPPDAAIVVSKEGEHPRLLTLPDFYLVALVEEYRRLADEPARPFPRDETVPAKIPPKAIVAADVKGQLGALIQTSAPGMKDIVRLQFPEGVDSLLVPQASVAVALVEAAVAKVSRYLQDGKNAAYAETKLLGGLRGSEVAVRQAMEDVALRPKKAAATVMAPTDFTFRFWTLLSNLVIKDFQAKSEKTDQDMAVIQSAYIIGYAVFHKKGAVQREREWSEDRKRLETQVRKAPFVFGFQDLYALTDEKGTPFVTKHSQDFIHSFLKEKTTRGASESLPSIIRVHAKAQKKDYFIHKDYVVPVFLRKLAECSEELRKRYLDEWTAGLKEDRPPDPSRSDAAFRRDVEQKVTQGFPLVIALANGGLLSLIAHEGQLSEAARKELAKCFAVENILRPFDELLGLTRTQLLKSARMFLPFWMTVPILSGIIRLFRRMFTGRGRREEEDEPGAGTAARPEARIVARSAAEAAAPPPAGAKDNLLRYKRSVQSLVSQYVPKGSTIDATLAELAEKWNPLFAAAQKKNLVEDVNALVRDFIRPIRKSFLVRPPDLKRIHSLAEQLSVSKALAQIKKRDPLLRYIELYMIRCLQVKQL
ncbi:MAG TPA: hypothetical protein VFI08_07265 [Spirochaetia bacterium]|nr:hypothetical protein [Spirochaetia bacterium]